MINLANRTTAFSNFKPSKGSKNQIWVQDLQQFLFQTLMRSRKVPNSISFSQESQIDLNIWTSHQKYQNCNILLKASKDNVFSLNQHKFLTILPEISDLIKFESKTSTNSSFRPSKGPLIKFDLFIFSSEESEGLSSREKHALAPISDPKKSKALNLSVKQEPIQISDPHQAKWINFERKTCTNSDFRLNDQIW